MLLWCDDFGFDGCGFGRVYRSSGDVNVVVVVVGVVVMVAVVA